MEGPHRQRIRLLTWEPGRIDWLASSVQLVGTVFFNISTVMFGTEFQKKNSSAARPTTKP